MWIAEFKNYKAFLNAVIKNFPKKGRGQARKLAEHLNVAPMVVSHVLSRDRDFTPDQAVKVADFFGLDARSTEYFLYLVSLARAETKDLKKFYEARLLQLREESQNIKNLVKGRDALSEADKGTYYSNWYYSGIMLLSSIKKYQTVEAMAEYFELSRSKVGEIVSFLVDTGLCAQDGNRISMRIKSTHLHRESPFINNHRRNWRAKAREKFSEPDEHDLFYSSPVSLSEKDAEDFRKELLDLIKRFSKQVEASPEEKLMCLNIDWFEF